MSAPIRLRAAAGLAVVALALPGCLTTYHRSSVVKERNLQISLRAERRGGRPVDSSLAHPATISPVRVANILARIDVRDDTQDGIRRAAIPTELLSPIAAAVPRAFAEANPSQKVVVRAVRTTRRLGVFAKKFMTGMVLWMQDDDLVLSLTHLDVRVERSTGEPMPEPFADRPQGAFRVVGGRAMSPVASNTLLIAWKDPVFRQATHVRSERDGRLMRREVLLEDEAVEAPEASEPLPDGLAPEALRRLADLEELRRDGRISEAEYQRRRQALLEGREP